jgi:hypothetical protein
MFRIAGDTANLLHDVLKSLVMRQWATGERFNALSVWVLLIAVPLLQSLSAEQRCAIQAAEIDRSVVASISNRGTMNPKVISHIDLTKSFKTVGQWTFVAVQEGGAPPSQIEDHGPILLCLVKASKPDCAGLFNQPASTDQPWYHLLDSRIVYAGPGESSPLLLVKVCTAEGFNGGCGMATALYRYDRPADRFIRVFVNVTGRNNNQVTRFVERGPLQGDVIVDYPTAHAPYTYWIEVYHIGNSNSYVRILRYRGSTGYNDGNPLAVVDSEMPEILRHLGLWHPGDALPLPAHMPQRCTNLSMQKREEWCR